MADIEAPVCFNFKNSIYKRKGYYRKLVFVLLVFAYLASVCATLVLRLGDFSLNGKGKLHSKETKRVRRDTGLVLEPLTAGKLHLRVYIKFSIAVRSHMSQCMRFPTMWYVLPTKAQTSLRIRAVRSEPLLVP